MGNHIGRIRRLVYKAWRVWPEETGRITENVLAVRTGIVNCYVYQKGGDTVCFDCGVSAKSLRRELDRLGVAPEAISHLFLTHSDYDHAGGIGLLKSATVYLCTDEEQMITRKTPRKFKVLYNAGIKSAYRTLSDGDEIMAGGIRIKGIATPGHTPGSMSYLVDGTYLFPGDAMGFSNGKARPINPALNMERDMVTRSIEKLARLDGVGIVFTAHMGHSDKFESAMSDYRNRPNTPDEHP